MSKVLIDGDTVLIKSLFAAKGYYAGLRACNFTIENILSKFEGYDYLLGIGGSGNFRKEIYPEYKANRDPAKLPPYLYEAKQYLKKYWGAVSADGMETDDLLAMEYEEGDVLVVQDKDYKQIKSKQYNYWNGQFFEIDNPEFYFYRQMLTGDTSDHIPGVLNPEKMHWKEPPNFTDATATQVLLGKNQSEMKETVTSLYQQVYGERWFELYDTRARLLFLRRKDTKEYYDVFG